MVLLSSSQGVEWQAVIHSTDSGLTLQLCGPLLRLYNHMSVALGRNRGDHPSWPLPPPSVSSHKPGAQGWVGGRGSLTFICVTQGTP